jgi:hypothetical protein
MIYSQDAAIQSQVRVTVASSQRHHITSWPRRLAAVIAVALQMVAAIGGVLLLLFWIWATLDATLLDL